MSKIDREALVERLLRYVQIDSETGDEGEMARRLEEDFRALGCVVTTDDVHEAAQTTGSNIYATLPGDPSLEPLMLSAHMDTVIPGKGVRPRVCEDGYIRSDGSTVLGGDDKAGVCAIMEAMKAVSATTHRTVEAVITVREESGLVGAKNLDYSRIHAKKAVVLDTGGTGGDIITRAPGQNKIVAVIHGKKAHAGSSPEKGISAIQAAAHGVAAMNLLRVDEETTCNIGTFMAEGPTNIVNATARLVLEVRSRSEEKLEAQTKHLVDCLEEACRKFGAQLETEVTTSYLGFSLSEEEPLVQWLFQAAREVGLEPRTVGSGGGSDANIYNRHGITAVNIGVGMEKVHTTEEQLSIKDMTNTAEMICRLLQP